MERERTLLPTQERETMAWKKGSEMCFLTHTEKACHLPKSHCCLRLAFDVERFQEKGSTAQPHQLLGKAAELETLELVLSSVHLLSDLSDSFRACSRYYQVPQCRGSKVVVVSTLEAKSLLFRTLLLRSCYSCRVNRLFLRELVHALRGEYQRLGARPAHLAAQASNRTRSGLLLAFFWAFVHLFVPLSDAFVSKMNWEIGLDSGPPQAGEPCQVMPPF